MPEALCGGWPLLRAASVGRYALPEGGEMERMTGEGGGADTPPRFRCIRGISLCA